MSCTTKDENLLKENSQEEDLKSLSILYNNIKLLANNKTCENSNHWSFTAIGNKACGGPKEYIVYSLNIDTITFLDLVQQYSEAEKHYNQKWNISSDCSLPQQPNMVICNDGVPTFKY